MLQRRSHRLDDVPAIVAIKVDGINWIIINIEQHVSIIVCGCRSASMVGVLVTDVEEQ